LTHTSLEKDTKASHKSTDFKVQAIDMSSESVKESEIVDVSFEKVTDTIDFSGSVESSLIEVGTETFGEKHTICIDTLTSHEAKVNVEETSTEFMCNMVECESFIERKYIEESWSHVGSSTVEVSCEFRSLIVDCSSEYTFNIIESQVDQMSKTDEVGVESLGMKVIDTSSMFELSCESVECETVEIVEEIIPQTDNLENAEIIRVENESVGCEIKMLDISTTVKPQLVDISSESVIEHVEYSGEWCREIKHESEIFETEKSVCLNTIISSDEDVQYCSVEIQFEETKSRNIESGYEIKCIMEECYNEFEVNYFIFD